MAYGTPNYRHIHGIASFSNNNAENVKNAQINEFDMHNIILDDEIKRILPMLDEIIYNKYNRDSRFLISLFALKRERRIYFIKCIFDRHSF